MSFETTGGQQVNKRIFDLLEEKGHLVSFSQKLHPAPGRIEYLLSNMLHIFEYLKYDRIIVDTSGWRKTIWFVLLVNLLGKKNKLIGTLHHFGYIGRKGLNYKISKFFEILFVKSCGKIIIFSPYIRDISKSYINDARMFYVGLPFDKNMSCVEDHVFGKLLYVGTIEERKGLLYLIDAIAMLPQSLLKKVELNIVGKPVSDSYSNLLKARINNFGIQDIIHFRGRVDDEELQRLYSESMIFTFPSLLEGFGMVLIEAMGHGLPVICFNNTAMPYTVKTGENGIVASNQNVMEFSKAIQSILEDEQLFNKLHKGCLDTFKKAQSYSEFDKRIICLIKEL